MQAAAASRIRRFGRNSVLSVPGNSFAGRVSGSGGSFPTRIVSDSWPSGHHGEPSVLNDRGGRLPSKPIRRMGVCFWGPCSDAPSALSSDSERLAGRIPNRRSARIHLVDSGCLGE